MGFGTVALTRRRRANEVRDVRCDRVPGRNGVGCRGTVAHRGAGDLDQQGMSSGARADLIDTVGTRMQDSLLTVRHGGIVAEAYYAPYRSGIPHDLGSVTRSIIGTLTAIEVRDGVLDGVNDPVLDLFANQQIADVDERKRALTVGGTPALQQSISGRSYRLEENRFHLTTISLRLTGDVPMWVLETNTGKPGAAIEFFPGPLGLDGRFRLAAPNRFGVAAARGRWVSDNRFEIERHILGGSATLAAHVRGGRCRSALRRYRRIQSRYPRTGRMSCG